MAVRTNYYPLWEAERGRFRLTHRVEKPKPLRDLLRMIGKFSHLSGEEIRALEDDAHERYRLIEAMARSMPLESASQ